MTITDKEINDGKAVNKMPSKWLQIILACIVLLGFVGVTAVHAHEGIEIGPYLVTIGWEIEPAIVGERNAIVIEVTKSGAPVTGLADTLELRILYAGRVFLGDLEPTATPGLYRAEILPTVRGQYTAQLTGKIEDLAVDESLAPEEVLTAAMLQFPEKPPETLALQAAVDDLSARLQTATILAITGLVIGLLGLGGAVFSLARRERSK